MCESVNLVLCSGAAALPRLPFPNAWCSPFGSDPELPSAEQQLLPELCLYRVLDELEESRTWWGVGSQAVRGLERRAIGRSGCLSPPVPCVEGQ